MTPSPGSAPTTARSLDWWVRDDEGRLTVALWPNPALGVWLVAKVLAWSGVSSVEDATLAGIGTGALVVWAVDELLRGSSPFRRALGAVVLAAQLYALLA